MTDYGAALRAGIPAPGTGRLVEAPSPPGAGSGSSAAVVGQGPRGKESHGARPELLNIHHLPGQPHMSTMDMRNTRVMDPLSIGIPHGTRPVVPRPVARGPMTVTTPPPASLASPLHCSVRRSPVSSPGNNPAFKSTNFHNIADLIGGANTSHRSDRHSPDQLSPCARNCVKQQTTPTSNPRPGDSSDDYIDVVDEEQATSPDSSFSSDLPNGATSPVGKPKEARPTGTENNRARKGRTIYKAQQVYVLEEIFRRTHYPDPEVIETLSRDLDISENKIKVWFQNKRARWRRRAAETGHPVLPPLGYNPMGPSGGVPGWHHAPPGGLHLHPANPAGALLMPQPVYPGLQGSHQIPLSQHSTPLSMIPQLQSFYSMEQGFMNLKNGLHNFPQLHHGINLPMMHMWPESTKLSTHSS